MMLSKKIAVFTGTRAEYGLLSCLMTRIQETEGLELQLIVSGMHLSPEFGLTYQHIEKDGYKIDKKIEMLMSSDTSVGIVKSMGIGMISYAEVLEDLQPDLLVILGDRYEALSMATACLIHKVPIVHLHGGEITEGAFDESIRHAITKLSSLHFASTEEYRNRIIQLGEHPDRVFNVGGLGIENIKKLDLLSKESFEDSIEFKLGKKNALITYHPVTLEKGGALNEFKDLLEVLDELEDTHLIFTMPNSDTNGRAIIKMIEEYVQKNSDKACCFTSLGQLRYLSALQYMDIVVGNSSSGVIEVPSFNIATLDIGDRQKGRVKGASVIECSTQKDAIKLAINKALSKEFKVSINNERNPYDAGLDASKIIVETLLKIDPTSLIRKPFYDL